MCVFRSIYVTAYRVFVVFSPEKVYFKLKYQNKVTGPNPRRKKRDLLAKKVGPPKRTTAGSVSRNGWTYFLLKAPFYLSWKRKLSAVSKLVTLDYPCDLLMLY